MKKTDLHELGERCVNAYIQNAQVFPDSDALFQVVEIRLKKLVKISDQLPPEIAPEALSEALERCKQGKAEQEPNLRSLAFSAAMNTILECGLILQDMKTC